MGRSRPPNPTTLRRNQKLGKPTRPNSRTQRPSPSQRPIHGARGTSKCRHLLIPRVPCPFPDPQAMEGPQTMLGRPRPTTPLPIQRFPLPDAFTPAHCVPVSRAGQPTPGLARPSCLVCPAVPAIRPPGGCTGTPVLKDRLRRHVPRQRSGQVPLPEGSATHNPDHSRQRVGIGQTGADGSAATSGLDSSHGPSIACPLPIKTETNTPKPNRICRKWNIRLGQVLLRRTKEKPGVSLIC